MGIETRLVRAEEAVGTRGPCPLCGGEGTVKALVMDDPPDWLGTGATCPRCGRSTVRVLSPEDAAIAALAGLSDDELRRIAWEDDDPEVRRAIEILIDEQGKRAAREAAGANSRGIQVETR